MSVEVLGQEGPGVGDSLLKMARDIFVTERHRFKTSGRDFAGWPSDSENDGIFTPRITLPQIKFLNRLDEPEEDLEVASAVFDLPEEGMRLQVYNGATKGLDDDPFVVYFFDKFSQAFNLHTHELCLAGLARRLEYDSRKAALLSHYNKQAQQDSLLV